MIPLRNIRSAIVRGLSTFIGIKVIEMNVNAPIPSYPFVTYNFTDDSEGETGLPIILRDGNKITNLETVEFTVSFHAYGTEKADCMEYALQARDWFVGPGHQVLKDAVNVVTVEIGNVESRDIQIGQEWERRNGFEVTFRTVNQVEYEIETIETATITRS